jgi:peroxiredoxin
VIQKKMMVFQQKNMPVMQAAQQKNDTVTMNRLNKEFMGIQKETVAANEKYITDSPKSFLSILLVEGMFNQQSDAAKITAFYDALDSDIKATKPGKRVAKKIAELKKYKDSQKKTEVGQIAPDFSAKNPEGKIVSLKQSLGKLTIIDFWASWCRPCREGNPAMVALYNEYHPKGLNIIGVSLDKEGAAKEWKDAIAKDQLAWIHVSNLKFWDEPISKLYAIQSIPTAYLLDANGRIIAKDLQGEALKKKVAELLP